MSSFKSERVTEALLALGFQPAAAARDSGTRQVLERLYNQAFNAGERKGEEDCAQRSLDRGLDVVAQQHNAAIARGGRS